MDRGKPAHRINEAAHAFLDAVRDDQIATRDMHVSLQRLSGLFYEFSKPLKHIVKASGSALTPAARLNAPPCRAS